jgi:hypothetical protein
MTEPEDTGARDTEPDGLLGGSDGGDSRGGTGDDYSATALDDGWVHRTSEAGQAATLRRPQPDTDTDTDVAPDRVEGDVLRFGPGVTGRGSRVGSGTTTAIWHGTLPGHDNRAAVCGKRRSGLRRYTLAAVVLLAVVAFLLWQRLGPALSVESVAVRTDPRGPGCDGTADVVGVVRTNGRAGAIDYRWLRSDGTASGPLRERVTRGQREARLHLLWTFRGRGTHQARAELEITSPGAHTGSVRFPYDCR